jgi:hypothetical protein
MKEHFALWKNYLPRNLTAKFESDALEVYTRALNYLQKWFPFESLQYRAFQVLSLENVEKSQFLDEIIDIWMLSPLKNKLPSDALHEKLAALESVFSSLLGNSVEKWCSFFSKESAQNLLKIVQYVVSIPVSN